ncbi:sulfurtransferase TusA family protein, partial [Staphylococcus saprophyticus]|uniref:sulfurtransferase TusA family protein n=1 Tax=Staphylococcus saprophyticus TaxID=29385 RepID=UPI003703B2B2
NHHHNTLQQNTNLAIKPQPKQFNYTPLQSPPPILNITKQLKNIQVPQQIHLTLTHPPFFTHIKTSLKQTPHTLLKLDQSNNPINPIIQKQK